MRRFLNLTLLCALFLLFAPACGFAVQAIPVLEVTGVLSRVDNTVMPHIIVLSVEGQEASGPIFEGCIFFDEKGNVLDEETFVRRFLKRIVTLEIFEDSGEVVRCRVGS